MKCQEDFLIDINELRPMETIVASQILVFMRLSSYLAIIASSVYAVPAIDAQIRIQYEDPIEFKIEEIGVDQGLSQGMIHGLAVDHRGYLWIGTKDGLNRYDGEHFHVLRNDPHDPNSISTNYIRSLHVDDHGLLWVGTNTLGLDLYNPSTEGFIHFGNKKNQSGKSTIQSISGIFSAPDGSFVIWDGTGENAEILIPVNGKNPYTVDAWIIKSFTDVYPLHATFPHPSRLSMLGFAKDGALLHVIEQTLVFLYPDAVKSWKPHDPMLRNGVPANTTLPFDNSNSYFIDHHRRPYCLNREQRILFIWDENAGTLLPKLKLPESYPMDRGRFFVDSQDRIWNNSSKTNYLRIDPQEGIYQELLVNQQQYNGKISTDYSIFYEDRHHNLWGGTSGKGLVKISSRNDLFTRQYPVQSKLENSVVENGKSFSVDSRFGPNEEKKLRNAILRKDFVPVSAYVKDARQQIWFLAAKGHQSQYYLIHMEPATYSFESFPIDLCQNAGTAEGSIMLDHNGILWLGGECGGGKAQLLRVASLDGPNEHFTFPVDVIRTEHPFISDWYVDDENTFWIATKQGLFFFDPATEQWKHFQVDATRQDALSNNHVLSICPDVKAPEKYLWIGTDGGGLNKLDIKASTFSHYTIANGLPNNVIYGVQSDAHGQLWLSTNFGLCRFDPETSDVWSFTVEDGLAGNEFNRFYYGKDEKGLLYFGGVEGLTIIDPEDFYSTGKASPIVINRLKLSNKEVMYTSLSAEEENDSYILPAPIEYCQQLTFPYTERMITLGFSLLDFTNPNGNKYRYKLEGFNKDWIEAGSVNEAVFTNLNPGKYTFLVSGSNSQNIWSVPAQIQLIILTPWWATWWFRSLVVAIIAAGFFAFYRYRLQQTIKLQHIRNRIAADLHDEIGSTLSSISLAGAVIQHKLNNSHPEVEGFLQKINHNTQKMMEAMSDIVWAVNTKNDRFEQVLYRMRAFAVEILEPKEVMIHFDVSPHISQLQLDMQQRKNLYLIFKEVIHNAAKYAHCKNVWITLNYVHGRLIMKVRDDGIGFVYQAISVQHKADINTGMGGNGIQNLYQRAIELKGKLEVDSVPKRGTTVTLTFAI